MGSCFSRSEFDHPLPVAKVISMNGELHEYAFPLTVSHVLHLEVAAPPTSSSTGFFVCDSDRLYYDECIPALAPGEELVGNQIYFVLPGSRLNQRLTLPEMAALAVKASLALQEAEEKSCGGHRRRRKASARISPVVEVSDGGGYYGFVTNVGYGRASVN